MSIETLHIHYRISTCAVRVGSGKLCCKIIQARHSHQQLFLCLDQLDQMWTKKGKSRIRHYNESGISLDIQWYPERVPFIRRNTHKYKYKFFSYKKVAPKVAPFFIRYATGVGIVLRASGGDTHAAQAGYRPEIFFGRTAKRRVWFN